MIQIIINGTIADYDARRNISYKCVTGWLSTDNLFSEAMYNISLPATLLNNRLLGYPSNPAISSAAEFPCTVICAGAQIIDGTLRISKVTESAIQAIITDRLADLYANLRDMTFESSTRELPLHATTPLAGDLDWAPAVGPIQETSRIFFPMLLSPKFYSGVECVALPPSEWGKEGITYESWHNMPIAGSGDYPTVGTTGHVNTESVYGTSYFTSSIFRRAPFSPALLMKDVLVYAAETAGWELDTSGYPAVFDRLAVMTGYDAGALCTIGAGGVTIVQTFTSDNDGNIATIKLSDWGRTVNLSDLLIGFCQLANTGIEADISTRTMRIVDKEAQLAGASLTDLTRYAVSAAEIDVTEYDSFTFSYAFGGDSYNEEIAKIDSDPSLIISDDTDLPEPAYRYINKYALTYGASGLFQCVKLPADAYPSWAWKGLAYLLGYRSAAVSDAPYAVQCGLQPYYYPGENAIPFADLPAYRADFPDVPAQPLRISFIPPMDMLIPRHYARYNGMSLNPADIASARYALLSRLATQGKPFAQTFAMPADMVRAIARNKYGVYSCAGKAFVIDELTAELSASTGTAIVKLTGIYL